MFETARNRWGADALGLFARGALGVYLGTGATLYPMTTQLSPRQQQVLDLWLAGHTYREVAAELGMAPGTVYPHLKTIVRKLGATGTSRSALRDACKATVPQ